MHSAWTGEEEMAAPRGREVMPTTQVVVQNLPHLTTGSEEPALTPGKPKFRIKSSFSLARLTSRPLRQ